MGAGRYVSLFHTAVSDYLSRPVREALGLRNYPTQLNYPVTGFCNSRCAMCNVWKAPPKWDRELTAGQLYQVLSDPLFSRIQHWGLAGGEPTLRGDLVEVVAAGLKALPSIKTVTISSHGFHAGRIQHITPQLIALANERNVRLRYSISLDGVNAIHDRVRGIPGAYRKVMDSISWLQSQRDVDLVVGATISKVNVQYLFDLWHHCVKNGIPYNFRVATSIERLDNLDLKDVWAFDETETYVVAEFLENLAHDRRSSLERRVFYGATRKLLTDGAAKSTQCRFKREGIYLDEEGELHHCAVYGKSLGNAVGAPASQMFFSPEAAAIQADMWHNVCPSCIHDYRTFIPLRDVVGYAMARLKLPQMRKVGVGMVRSLAAPKQRTTRAPRAEQPVLYITGWYGTETAGDKAILGAIFDIVRHQYPGARFLVGSYTPFYTRRSVAELDAIEFAEVVPVGNAFDLQQGVDRADGVIVGGGPLMDIPEMFDVLRVFQLAAARGIPRIIFGCGVGPVRLVRTRFALAAIGRLATHAVVRDEKSRTALAELTSFPYDGIRVAVDPAAIFAARAGGGKNGSKAPLRLGVSIRSLPKHYTGNMSKREVTLLNDQVISAYATALDAFAQKYSATVRLIPMNTFHAGDDDRWVQSELLERMVRKDRVEANTGVYSVHEVLGLVNECDVFLAMRFHSAVFSCFSGIPTAAVEYNIHGGKVQSLMDRVGLDGVINVREVNRDAVLSLLDDLVEKSGVLAAQLSRVRRTLPEEGLRTYSSVLGEALGPGNGGVEK